MKPHYPILDGLRGTAAILVVLYHLGEPFFPPFAGHPMAHGYLAVDFFFLLSGFVVGYAYDDRWERMTVWEFFKIRLIRLHPLVILGVTIGAIGFLVDPYTYTAQHINYLKFAGAVIIGFTLLPSPDVRGWNETHSLDGPCWSLFQEYLANILYALFLRKLNKSALGILVFISGLWLGWTANHHGHLGTGWGYDTLWIGVTRMLFPFCAGLLLFRSGKRIRVPMAYLLSSLLLIILFFTPFIKYNGLFEAAIVIIGFPIVVAMGAGGTVEGRWARVCKFSGDISYPIYIVHYPFIYIYTSWIALKKPTGAELLPIACGLFVLFMLLAYAALKLYDVPVRAWLRRKYLPAKVKQ